MWNTQETLSRDAWEEFYQRVMAVLANYRPREAASLDDALPDLRHQFFIERVMPGEGRNGPAHADDLRLYFRRFLLDLQRSGMPDMPPFANPPCEPGAGQIHRASLDAYGVSPESAEAGARAFLAGLPEASRLLLRACGCGGTVSGSLAARIAAGHFGAGSLGLVHRRGGDRLSTARQNLAPAHSQTLLSRWLTQTLCSGTRTTPLDPANRGDTEAAQALLDILCTIALTEQARQADPAASQRTA